MKDFQNHSDRARQVKTSNELGPFQLANKMILIFSLHKRFDCELLTNRYVGLTFK